jgi:hypothetical protein
MRKTDRFGKTAGNQLQMDLKLNFFPQIENRLKNRHLFYDYYLTQALTNHGNNRQYLARFRLLDIQDCTFCHSAIDGSNLRIFDCNKFINQRQQLMEKYRNIGIVWPPTHQSLIKKELINDFLIFVKKIFVII